MPSKISKHDANADLHAFQQVKKQAPAPPINEGILSFLPADLLEIIFRFVVDYPADISKLELTCKSFYVAINSNFPLKNSWAQLLVRIDQAQVLQAASTAIAIKALAKEYLNSYRIIPLDHAITYARAKAEEDKKKNYWCGMDYCKLVITGTGGVGKGAYTIMFMQNVFVSYVIAVTKLTLERLTCMTHQLKILTESKF